MIVARVPVFALSLPLVHILADRHRNIALELLDFPDDLKLCRRVEHVALSPQQQLQVLGHISPANVDALDAVINREAFKDGRAVAAPIATVKNESGGLSTGVQRENGLLLEEDLGRAERLEEDVRRLRAVAVRVQWRLSQQDRMLLGRDLELIEDMSPDLLHVVPVLNHAVFDGPVQFKNAFEFFLKDLATNKLTAASPIKVSCSF